MTENKDKDIEIVVDVDIEDQSSNELKDIGYQGSNETKKEFTTDELIHQSEQLMKAAKGFAGSLGRIIEEKGSQLIDRVEDTTSYPHDNKSTANIKQLVIAVAIALVAIVLIGMFNNIVFKDKTVDDETKQSQKATEIVEESEETDSKESVKTPKSDKTIEFSSNRVTMDIPEWWNPQSNSRFSTTEVETYTIGENEEDPDGYLLIRTSESDYKLAFSDETFLKMLDTGAIWNGMLGDEPADITETKKCSIDGCNGLMMYRVSYGSTYEFTKCYCAIFHPDKKSGIEELGDHYTSFQILLFNKDNDFTAFDAAIDSIHFEYRDEDKAIIDAN